MINTCSSSPSGTYSTAANHWSGHKSIDCWAMGIHIIYQHDNVNGCWSASDSHTTAGALYVECPTSNYQYSAYASNTCPSGCSAINDLQACKDAFPSTQTMYPAASAIGNSGTASGNYGTGRPGGCFLHNPNKHLHFNTNSVGGSSHGNDYKICSCGGGSSYVDVGSGHCVDSSNRRPPHCYTQSITDENTCKSACTAVSGCSAYEWGQTGGYCQLIWTTGISSLNSAQHSATTGSCSSSVLNNWKYNLNGDSNYAGGAIQQTYHNTGGKCYRKEGGGDNQYKCFTMGTYAPVTAAPQAVPSVAPQGSAQYQYSDLGSNSCPSGCSAINDLQTCKNTLSDAQSMNPAASQLGGNTAGTGSGGNYGSGRPGGCFLHNPNKHIHFNTDSTGGNSHGDDYKICKC